jgi:prenyl protein peptidase
MKAYKEDHPGKPIPTNDWISKRKSLLIALLKLGYTQVFGMYSGMVYIKTGSLWAAIALHSQCNFFGFPSFGNLFNNNYRNTDRLMAVALYVIGTAIFFYTFNWFLKDLG